MLFRNQAEIDEKLNKIFLDIRDDKKIIDRKIKLSIDKNTGNIQGLNFFNLVKRIRYNPVFYTEYLSKYNVNIIRFVLLHESGHISKYSWFKIENILILFASITAVFITLISIFVKNFFLQIIYYTISLGIFLILLRIIAQSFFNSLKNGEFEADEYALKKISTNYEIPNQCEFIKELFNFLNAITTDPNVKDVIYPSRFRKSIFRLVVKLVGYEEGYHPENQERMDHLRKIAQC